MKKLSLLACMLSLAGCHSNLENTVKITNLAGNSGGSGTIIKIEGERKGSTILTNAHVCGVVKQGGLVSTDSVTAFVTAYKVSKVHDLCAIKVLTKLAEGAEISPHGPQMYDPSIVLGHPNLLPTIVSEGKFSGKMVVSVMIGSRPCTEEEANSAETGLFCALAGGMPIIKNYETIATSSLIMPGSSGSGVYGANGAIQAVIFAGRGDIGFGFAVPHEYVSNFVHDEQYTLDPELPHTEFDFASQSSRSGLFSLEKAKKLCNNPKYKSKKVCTRFRTALKYDDMIYKTK